MDPAFSGGVEINLQKALKESLGDPFSLQSLVEKRVVGVPEMLGFGVFLVVGMLGYHFLISG